MRARGNPDWWESSSEKDWNGLEGTDGLGVWVDFGDAVHIMRGGAPLNVVSNEVGIPIWGMYP